MLSNLERYAHTLDAQLRFSTLSNNDFPQQSHAFQLPSLPGLPPAFRISLLPEPRLPLSRPSQQSRSHTQPQAKVAVGPPPSLKTRVDPPAASPHDQPIPAHIALTHILDLVTSQTTCPLFEWNQPALRFQWRSPPLKKHRPNPPAPIQIQGLSPATTLSTSRPFLKTATLIRRTSAVLDALVASGSTTPSADELPREAHALIYALRHVLDWLRRELIEWQDRHTAQQQYTLAHTASASSIDEETSPNVIGPNTRALLIISEAAHGLQTCERILDAITELLNCPFTKQPPFRPLPGLNLLTTTTTTAPQTGPGPKSKLDLRTNPGALLSHIYAHATASFTTSPCPLVRGTMAWILEHTTAAWRMDISTWIGWPLQTPGSGSGLGSRGAIALELEGGQKKAVREPWCGAQVEQERDERGELDTGYVLRPARIPSFLSLSAARQLLEAGRALHLLHTATDGQHPLFHLHRHRHSPFDSQSNPIRHTSRKQPASTVVALPVPTWTFGTEAQAARLRSLDGVLLATTNLGARWVYHGKRKRVADAGSGRPSAVGGGAAHHQPQGVLSSWMEGLHPAGRGGSPSGGTTMALLPASVSGGSAMPRGRRSSLRLFPSRSSAEALAPPPLPIDASQKLQEARRVDLGKQQPPQQKGLRMDGDDPEGSLEKAIRLFDALPGLHLLADDDEGMGGEKQRELRPGMGVLQQDDGTVRLVDYLAAFCKAAAKEVDEDDVFPTFVTQHSHQVPSEQDSEEPPIFHAATTSPSFDLDAATRQTLLQPLLAWSRSINTALVSVFFRDLAVDLYLATCQRFLLLGSGSFRTRLVGVLFDDGAEGRGGVDEDRARARAKGGEVRQGGGVGLSVRLTSSTSWPPSGSELSVSLNLAVAETLAESKASHARLMASSRPLLSLSSLHAAEAALYDLDQRLSFSVIEMQAEKPRSIHALDWLTLTFTPPPLISPLLQAHASACYQRLFNFLLRILRVQTVLRGLAKSTLFLSRSTTSPSKPSTKSSAPASPPAPISVATLLFTHDPLLSAALHSFRFEAQHVVNALATYVADVAIGLPWTRFQRRLRQLARGAGAGAGSRGPAGTGTATTVRGGGGGGAGKSVPASEVGDLDDDDDGSSVWTRAGEEEDGEEDEEGDGEEGEGEGEEEGEEEEEGGERTEEAFQLFNVFSLSRYHERVLDRMLQACFLKHRFRGIMKIINDLFQLILDLGQLIQDVDAPVHTTDGKAEAEASAYPARERFYTLQARWKSRYALLAQSLRLVHLHSRSHHNHAGAGHHEQARTEFEQALAAAVDLDTSSAAVGREQQQQDQQAQQATPNVAELEMRRLEAEEELDLRALEDVEGRREQVSTAGVLLNLLALPSL